MSYINFRGTVKKANLKPGGEVEVVLVIPSHVLRGQFESLNDMIECQVVGGLDSQVVKFKNLLNAKTNKPLIQYKIDERGVVSEVKPEGEQLTADAMLGLPPEKVEVKEEQVEISLSVINDFILSGLAPKYDDLPYDFVKITERLAKGETYMKLAAEEGVAMMLFTMAIDEYRQRIAPLAMKWNEWREGKLQPAPAESEKAQEEDQADSEGESAVDNTDESDVDPAAESSGLAMRKKAMIRPRSLRLQPSKKTSSSSSSSRKGRRSRISLTISRNSCNGRKTARHGWRSRARWVFRPRSFRPSGTFIKSAWPE